MNFRKKTFLLTLVLPFISIIAWADGVNFNALIEESNQDRTKIENKYKSAVKPVEREYTRSREVVKFEAEEEAQVVNVKSQVDLEHHQKQVNKKSAKKNMAVEVQNLEDEIATVPEE